jgi:hypothetical protein
MQNNLGTYRITNCAICERRMAADTCTLAAMRERLVCAGCQEAAEKHRQKRQMFLDILAGTGTITPFDVSQGEML